MAEGSAGETLAKDAAQTAYGDERRKLATLCRIAASLGYIAEFGHISLRVAGTDIVLLTPGAGALKSTVTAEQIFVYDLNGKNLFHPNGLNVPIEFLIHTRIHRDRPEMLCVAHFHAEHSRLLGVVDRPLVPVIGQAIYLHKGVPTWDDPSLVVSDAQAASLSDTLADRPACLMRGHGSVVVGETAELALMNVYSLEENARVQIAAEPFGGPVPFSPEIIEKTTRARTAIRHEVATILWTYFEARLSCG